MSDSPRSEDHDTTLKKEADTTLSRVVLGNVVNPITALALIHGLLLAGEGPLLRFYNAGSCQLIHTYEIPSSEPIHGIKAQPHVEAYHGGKASVRALVWAGRAIFLLDIEHIQSDLSIKPVIEALADDRVLDAAFPPAISIDVDDFVSQVVLLTSHNVLLSFNNVSQNSRERPKSTNLGYVASGPRSLLYSAHIARLPNGRGIVAAGTVFGEVLVWSFSTGKAESTSPRASSSQLHQIFLGHEGSVFGVQLFESSPETADARRFVVSCSDDRTIRIWDVTDLNKQIAPGGGEQWSTSLDSYVDNQDAIFSTEGCIASTMGHISRIWGVHFLSAQQEQCYLCSHGEDATVQIWRLGPLPVSVKAFSTLNTLRLQHCSTYGLHSGKNIWAMAVEEVGGSGVRIATGGSDSRITTYTIQDLVNCSVSGSWQGQYQMKEIYSHIAPKAAARCLFISLHGNWKLQRSFDSAIPMYPSGTLEGTATFQKRAPTESSYDLEYLYTEKGQFVTHQGLTFSASRRYVYRSEKKIGQVSAWFVKPDDNETVDCLFHVLDFGDTIIGLLDSTPESTERSATASGHHLCIDDDYQADYCFCTSGTSTDSWSVKHTVKGPKKDYVSDSRYRRDDSSDQSPKSTHKASSEEFGPAPTDSFKKYTWINPNSFLVATGAGWVLLGTITDAETLQHSPLISWDPIGQLDDLKGTCLTANVQYADLVLLTGNNGNLYLYEHTSKDLHLVANLPAKVALLQASSVHDSFTQSGKDKTCIVSIFASCIGSSIALCLSLDTEDFLFKRSEIDLPPAFTTTSARFTQQNQQDILILGSRAGDILIYKPTPDARSLSVISNPFEQRHQESSMQQRPNTLPIDAASSFTFTLTLHIPHVHGTETVTSITTLPNTGKTTKDTLHILTTGRNSAYSIHAITQSSTNTIFQTLHTGTPPLGPNIEGAYFVPSTTQSPDLLIYGFRSNVFVVYNATTQQETMTVACGGAHRNWAYVPFTDSNGGGRLVYTKASALNLYSQAGPSHKVIQAGGHGREIKAIAASPAIEVQGRVDYKYIATGAEDTCIRIFRYPSRNQGENGELKCLHTHPKHITGIQQLRWSSDGRYLFSAAGREEFFVWKVQPVPCFEIGIVCVGECPLVTEAGDLRVMDFEVLEVRNRDNEGIERFVMVLVYSDSSVRIFCYDVGTSSWTLLSTGKDTTYCLTQAATLRLKGDLYFCTASTDGYVALWPLNAGAGHDDARSEASSSTYDTNGGRICLPPGITYTARFKIHQNSIMGLSAVQLSCEEVLLATVGDDGALAFSRIALTKSLEEKASPKQQEDLARSISPQISTLLIPKAHAAAATALQYLGCKSGGADALKSCHFVTAGNDQRIKTWLLTIDTRHPGVEGFTLSKEQNVTTAIADISSMKLVDRDDAGNRRVIIAGIGLETWSIGS